MKASKRMKSFNFGDKLGYLRANTYLISKIFFVLAAIAFVFRVVCRISTAFADFFNRRIASAVRFLMTSATNIFPFSLAEIIIMLLPLVFVVIIVFAVIFSKSKINNFVIIRDLFYIYI